MLARVLGWTLFTVWILWAFALQGALGAGGPGARWIPDLGLVLVLSLLVYLDAKDAVWCALCAAIARSVVSLEPAIVLLAGFALVVLLAFAARTIIELSSPLWRGVVTAGLVFTFDVWLIFVHHVRAEPSVAAHGGLALDPLALLPVALTSGLLAFLAGPLLAHLPGLTPLRSRRW